VDRVIIFSMIRKTMLIGASRTSIKLEGAFWDYLQTIAKARGMRLSALVFKVAADPMTGPNLASALRVFCLQDAIARLDDLLSVTRRAA
jgi:predicted DNA-binding ribbon-helix-helix protein